MPTLARHELRSTPPGANRTQPASLTVWGIEQGLREQHLTRSECALLLGALAVLGTSMASLLTI